MGNCNSGGCAGPDLHKAASDAKDEAVRESLGKIKHKLLVMSGKGGVGKTSVSVNLAIAISRLGFRAGILDVDIHGPDVPRMLGFDGLIDINEQRKLLPMTYSDNLSAVSIESIQRDKDEAIIWRGPLKHSIIRQFIADVEWGELDYLVVDSPPGTGDEPLSVAKMIPDAKAVIVTTPQEIALADVRKSINFCKTVNLEVAGIVENMSGYECPQCKRAVHLFGTGGGQRTAGQFGIPLLGRIPFDPNLVACGDAGVSFQEKHEDSAAAAAFKAVSEKIVQTRN